MKPKTKRVLKGAAKGAVKGAAKEVFTPRGGKTAKAGKLVQSKQARAAALKTAGKVALAAGAVAGTVIAARAVMRHRKRNNARAR